VGWMRVAATKRCGGIVEEGRRSRQSAARRKAPTFLSETRHQSRVNTDTRSRARTLFPSHIIPGNAEGTFRERPGAFKARSCWGLSSGDRENAKDH